MIDAHAHLTSKEDVELVSLLERADQANVKAIVNVCCDEDDLQRGLILASNATPEIYTVAAITPHDAAKEMGGFVALIEKAAGEKKLVAIGETGLDYYYEHAPKEQQKKSLRFFIRLAHRMQLPLVIHCRDAFADLFSIFDEEKSSVKVMLHCFTGTSQEAKEALSRGWYLSFSGCVTFPKNKELQEVALACPLEQMLIETDTPYLAPQPYRGRKNEPAYLAEIAKFIASLKQISLETLVASTSANTRQLFAL